MMLTKRAVSHDDFPSLRIVTELLKFGGKIASSTTFCSTRIREESSRPVGNHVVWSTTDVSNFLKLLIFFVKEKVQLTPRSLMFV